MENLARAIVNTLAYLESQSEAIGTEAADTAMEILAYHLRRSSPEERGALQKAVSEEYNAANAEGAPEETLDFYETFMETFVEDDEPAGESE